MPSSAQILDSLDAIANGWTSLAIAWHVVLGTGLLALVLGWRPGRRLAGTLLAIPLASVSVMAWLAGNPFNGTSFAILAAAIAAVALRMPRTPVEIGVPWLAAAGAALLAFAWVYPHFLDAGSWATYLYAAPLGLIPCPTLSAAVGVALVLRGLDSRALAAILSSGGVLYGLVGWLRLGVAIDSVLLAGAILLAVASASGLGGAVAPSNPRA